MGRSGSTLVFECLASHRDLGWFSHLANRAPSCPALNASSRLCDLSFAFRKAIERSNQPRSFLEKLRLGPAEAYEIWEMLCGSKFRYEWLIDRTASPAEVRSVIAYVARVLQWSGKARFAAKLTGPPRISFLSSIFPDACFVHIIRDGRAVARSLVQVDFWRNTYRLREPAWTNGFPAEYERLWNSCGRLPVALAALQWRTVIEISRAEAAALSAGQYHELHYEDFIADPSARLLWLMEAVGLPVCKRVLRFLEERFTVRDMNQVRLRTGSGEDEALLQTLIGATLAELGYGPPGAAA